MVRALIDALADRSEEVVQSVCYGLAEIGSPARAAVPTLIALGQRGSSKVRNDVGWALAHIGSDARKAVPLLLAWLNDPTGPSGCAQSTPFDA